jgi:hypothetical protein
MLSGHSFAPPDLTSSVIRRAILSLLGTLPSSIAVHATFAFALLIDHFHNDRVPFDTACISAFAFFFRTTSFDADFYRYFALSF